jgi:hypothetical protein
MPATHFAYSDESDHNVGNFHSIAMVSLPSMENSRISAKLRELLNTCNVEEFKWSKLRTAKSLFAAKDICSFGLDEAFNNRLRVDVLIWESADYRHQIKGINVQEDFRNMYIQLFKNVLNNRWPSASTWNIYPDQNTLFSWDYFGNALRKISINEHRRPRLNFSDVDGKDYSFSISEVKECDSKVIELVQLADLFAGIGVFSYKYLDVYKRWEDKYSSQLKLFDDQISITNAGNDEKEEKCDFLSYFLEKVKLLKLGVHLTSAGLNTPNPKNPINFWKYKSIRHSDKAPTKTKGTNDPIRI